MSGTSVLPLFNQEVFFKPDASTQHSYAYLPHTLSGRAIELAVYVLFGTGTGAGKVRVQSAPYHDYPATFVWANEGNTIDWAAADSTKVARLTGLFGALRLDIDTAVSGGTIRAWVIATAGT
jgi:hypothetical protein